MRGFKSLVCSLTGCFGNLFIEGGFVDTVQSIIGCITLLYKPIWLLYAVFKYLFLWHRWRTRRELALYKTLKPIQAEGCPSITAWRRIGDKMLVCCLENSCSNACHPRNDDILQLLVRILKRLWRISIQLLWKPVTLTWRSKQVPFGLNCSNDNNNHNSERDNKCKVSCCLFQFGFQLKTRLKRSFLYR